MAVIVFSKQYTETLDRMLERFRVEYPEYERERVTYAGRLDPMAQGLMILLTGEDVHNKEQYLGLDKLYDVTFVLGVSTDTYDILGVAKKSKVVKEVTLSALQECVQKLEKIIHQEYPPYSSKAVQGKPLYQWAREGRLGEITLPSRDIIVSSAQVIRVSKLPSRELLIRIEEAISGVKGDFRQQEILDTWKRELANSGELFTLCTVRFRVSSGTYIRSLVHELGNTLQTGACSCVITRVEAGDYKSVVGELSSF